MISVLSLSCLPLPLAIAAVRTPPCLVAAWIPPPQNVSPRWVNIDFLFLRARGVVVSHVLVPLPFIPSWAGLQMIPGWVFPSRAGCTFPHPVPHPQHPHPLPLMACSPGRGATPTLFRFQGFP